MPSVLTVLPENIRTITLNMFQQVGENANSPAIYEELVVVEPVQVYLAKISKSS